MVPFAHHSLYTPIGISIGSAVFAGLMVMHRCRHGKAPQYLVDCCTPVTDVVGRQRLRSATQQLMVVPRHRLSTVGRRTFAVHGPMVWNSLPDDLRAEQNYESFRQCLKPGFSPDTSVFSALETFVIIALYKSTFTIPYYYDKKTNWCTDTQTDRQTDRPHNVEASVAVGRVYTVRAMPPITNLTSQHTKLKKI